MRATFFLLPNCNGKQILSGHLLLTWTEPRGEVKSFKRAPIVGGTVIAVYLWLQIAVPQLVVPLGRNGCMRPLFAVLLCCKLRTCKASAFMMRLKSRLQPISRMIVFLGDTCHQSPEVWDQLWPGCSFSGLALSWSRFLRLSASWVRLVYHIKKLFLQPL